MIMSSTAPKFTLTCRAAGQVVPKRDPDSKPGVTSAPRVPLPDFTIKLHTGDLIGKQQLLGDFTLLYLGSLANAEHTKQSLDRMMQVVQQQGRQAFTDHSLIWQQEGSITQCLLMTPGISLL